MMTLRTASRQPVPIGGEGIVCNHRLASLRPVSPEYLAKSGQGSWDESVNGDPPIFGWESPAASLPIYVPVTEKHTTENTRWNGRRMIPCRR